VSKIEVYMRNIGLELYETSKFELSYRKLYKKYIGVHKIIMFMCYFTMVQ